MILPTDDIRPPKRQRTSSSGDLLLLRDNEPAQSSQGYATLGLTSTRGLASSNLGPQPAGPQQQQQQQGQQLQDALPQLLGRRGLIDRTQFLRLLQQSLSSLGYAEVCRQAGRPARRCVLLTCLLPATPPAPAADRRVGSPC